MRRSFYVVLLVIALATFGFLVPRFGRSIHAKPDAGGTYLPTGKQITPLASPGSHFEELRPGLPRFPQFAAGQAMSTAIDPAGKTLLVLTSGYNRVNDVNGKPVPEASQEYVFVFDIASGQPKQKQVLQVPDTFAGLAFSPDGSRFFVSGGVDDCVHSFAIDGNGTWAESGTPIKLGHHSGLGLTPGKEPLAAGGLAVTPNGRVLLIANTYNDSVTALDVNSRTVIKELDLRPGKINATQHGVAGGEYPFWIVTGSDRTAYVSSIRDREVVKLSLIPGLRVVNRIKLTGNPNKMILNRARTRLFVASDNSDSVDVIDTRTDQILQTISTTGPASLPASLRKFTGSGPNALALAPDEKTIYVTNGGTNSLAVISLKDGSAHSMVEGLLPTGWYPTAVSVSTDGRHIYVTNGKSMPGPNPFLHNKPKQTPNLVPGPAVEVNGSNQYILQLEKAGLLTVPVPDGSTLDRLTVQVATNNGFNATPDAHDREVMTALHSRIKHVIYIIKENRTYDQVLGDLGRGNGEPALAEFGERITPNLHGIARQFVAMDNFLDSGEVSGDGWPWSTSGRESDFGEKAVPLNYANRGTNYEYEGLNRDLNVGLATKAQRKAANSKTPDDDDELPGAVNVAEADGPFGTPQGKGYIWDAVLRAGLTFREYGCMSDINLDSPLDPEPFKHRVVMSRPANAELFKYGDPYYRGFDTAYPDFYREAEWEREFDDYVRSRTLPSFEIVQLPLDHMGAFDKAISGVNTPEKQQADNDYAVGKLIDRLAHSPYKDDTIVISVEDDAQDGPDHVDAHRSTAYIAGPFVKQQAVVSERYTTVSVVRTIEDILGLQHLNLNTATTRPMTGVFDLNQKDWTFQAKPSAVLLQTQLPLSPEARKMAEAQPSVLIRHDQHYWAARTRGFNFSEEDQVDAEQFNRIVWAGLMDAPYPERRAKPSE
jgi:YVTN family beta-propeller protein